MLLGAIHVYAQPSIPKFQSFQPTSSKLSSAQSAYPLFAQSNPILAGNPMIDERNIQLMQQGGMTLPGMVQSHQSQEQELKRFLDGEKTKRQKDMSGNGRSISKAPCTN